MDSLADDSIQPDVTDDEKHQKAAANIKEVSNWLIRDIPTTKISWSKKFF